MIFCHGRVEPVVTDGNGLDSHIARHRDTASRIGVARCCRSRTIGGIIDGGILGGCSDGHHITRLVERRSCNGHIGCDKRIRRRIGCIETILHGIGRDGAVASHGQWRVVRLLARPTIRQVVTDGSTLRRGAQGYTIAVLGKRDIGYLEPVNLEGRHL